MRRFKIAYNCLNELLQLTNEARKIELEARAGGWFYDPKNKRYDDQFRQRYLQINERFNQELPSIKEMDIKATTLAVVVFVGKCVVFHPVEILQSMYRAYRHGVDR